MPEPIPIVCPYCGVGCNLELTLDEKGIPTKSSSAGRNKELNGKYLCIKGLSVHELVSNRERTLYPLIRKKGKLAKCIWDEAIGAAAGKLQYVINKYGPQSVGLLCSGKILNEEAYLSQKFQRTVIGNNNVDNCARLCHGPSEVALRKQLGFGAVSTFLEDYDVTETVVLVGAHTTSTHPVIWMRLRKNAKQRGINLILADPRETDLIKYANIHFSPRPGTDICWINALGKIMYTNGWHDEDFCRHHTIGFKAYLKSLESVDIDHCCARSGVARQDLEKAAELIHAKKPFSSGEWDLPSMHTVPIMFRPWSIWFY